MHLSKITIENFRCFGEGEDRFELPIESGLIALVGENDAGKSAWLMRYALCLGQRARNGTDSTMVTFVVKEDCVTSKSFIDLSANAIGIRVLLSST